MTEKTKAKSEKPARHRLLRRSFLLISGSILLILGSATAYAFTYEHKLPPHTSIAGVKVGGHTRESAKQVLRDRVTEFMSTKVAATYGEKTWNITPNELGTLVATDEAVDVLWEGDKTGSWTHQAAQLFRSLVQSRNVEVGFIPISDNGREFFKQQVLSTIETPYEETTLSFEPGKVSILPGKSGERLNEDSFELSLYKVLTKHQEQVELELEAFAPELTIDQAESARAQAEAILGAAWTLKQPSAVSAITVEPKEIASFLKTDVARDGAGRAVALKLTVKPDELQKLLTSWSDSVRQSATNADLAWDGSKISVVEEGVEGMELNLEKSLTAIDQQLSSYAAGDRRVLATVIDVTRPEVRSDTLEALGIKELIGTNTTDYTGSPTNRKFNIARGQRSLDRLLVKPGEIFSTTTALGPVEESTGYLAELVIKGNRTIPEAGGGLCQVSTTLFRSVLNAGLQITERQNHAYRVSYYERDTGPGLDATVYIPNPDLKWKNDMSTAVYIQSFVTKDNKVTFELFGTKDGRVATISAPEILETYKVGQPIYSNTDTLYEGETKQIEKPHDGAKTRVNYTVTRDGKEIYKKTFISVYKAWPAQYLVGTKVRTDAPPPAEATPTPDPTSTPSP